MKLDPPSPNTHTVGTPADAMPAILHSEHALDSWENAVNTLAGYNVRVVFAGAVAGKPTKDYRFHGTAHDRHGMMAVRLQDIDGNGDPFGRDFLVDTEHVESIYAY